MREQELIERRRLSPPPGEDFWVFAYGSLMWNPGFPFLESHPALVRGYHRSFCVESTHYRGTKEKPGLVLGLDRGGACRGRAYKVCRTQGKTVSDYLHEREMLSGIYEPRWLKATLQPAAGSPMEVPPTRDSPRPPPQVVAAAAFVVDRRHESLSAIAGRSGRRTDPAGGRHKGHECRLSREHGAAPGRIGRGRLPAA